MPDGGCVGVMVGVSIWVDVAVSVGVSVIVNVAVRLGVSVHMATMAVCCVAVRLACAWGERLQAESRIEASKSRMN